MRDKITFHKILFFIITLVLFVSSTQIYNSVKDTATGYSWKSVIEKLITTNRDMNYLVDKMLLRVDYDQMMGLMNSFETNLNILLDTDGSYLYGNIDINVEEINKLRDLFLEKRNILDAFNSKVMIATLLSQKIMHDSINLYKSIYFERIMPDVLLFRYDMTLNLTTLIKRLEDYLTLYDLKRMDQTFLENVKTLLEYYIDIQDYLVQMRALGINGQLNSIFIQNQNQIDRAVLNLKHSSIIVALLAMVAILMAYLGFSDAKRAYIFKNYLTQAMDNIFGSVVMTDTKQRIIYANKIFENTSGYTFADVKNQTLNVIGMDKGLGGHYNDVVQSSSSSAFWQDDEFLSKNKDGELLYEKVSFLPLLGNRGEKVGYLSIKFDRTKEILAAKELEKKEKELEERLFTDDLTGLGNYNSLIQALEQGTSGTIIYININNFIDFRFFYKTKTIDAIIASFAKTLQLCVDVYSIQARVYRVQFDEFYILYYGSDIKQDVKYLMSYMESNELSIVVDDKRESIPAIKTTIGVSLEQDTPQTNRITQAMLAHHEAQNKSEPISYYVENSSIEQQYYHNQIMSRTIEYALYNDTVIVECQGIYDISDTSKAPSVYYYEVLVRLIDENGKIRYPGEFLDIAKKISLYNDITKKVIEHTFRLIEKYPHAKFSMNLSSSDIENEGIRELLEQKLKICSYPEHLGFEILESEGVDDYKTVTQFINRMRSYHCKISIDDFGSGYSNYYRILELDADTIKIDGSIIKKLPFDKNARSLLSTIIGFAEQQEYNVVAEFVSSPEILAEVRKFGIKYAQGFLLGKPIPSNKI